MRTSTGTRPSEIGTLLDFVRSRAAIPNIEHFEAFIRELEHIVRQIVFAQENSFSEDAMQSLPHFPGGRCAYDLAGVWLMAFYGWMDNLSSSERIQLGTVKIIFAREA
jgi:hypothetical protein